MQSAGITVVADGTHEASERLQLSLSNDTSLGVLRYADAGYEASLDEMMQKRIDVFIYKRSEVLNDDKIFD